MDLIDDPAESVLTVVFEIPGVKTNDISLHILDGHLVVLGERRPTYTQKSEALPQDTAGNSTQEQNLTIPIQELRFGAFRRAIRIPENLKVRVLLHLHSQPPPTRTLPTSFPPYHFATD